MLLFIAIKLKEGNDTVTGKLQIRDNLAGAIKEYLDLLVAEGDGTFSMRELEEYVSLLFPTSAPDSTSRVLRKMRTQGLISYICVSRGNSTYRLLEVGDEAPGIGDS